MNDFLEIKIKKIKYIFLSLPQTDGLRWNRRVGLSDQDTKIYDSFPKGIGPVDPVKYNVTLPEPHTSTLVVNNVLLEDGGTYKCGAILATEIASDAHLIVAGRLNNFVIILWCDDD